MKLPIYPEINNADLWPLSYHLCGCTLLGSTSQEPLGALPLPIRLAVLKTAAQYEPKHFACKFYPITQLLHESGQHQTYSAWETKPPKLFEWLKKINVEEIPEFPTSEAYFKYYNLDRNKENDNDEHWAERQFIERVFLPLCGLQGLRYLKPQVPFNNSRQIECRTDFVLEGEKPYALEIEGETYHGGAARFDTEKARQRDLTQAGFQYFPISWHDVEQGKAKQSLHSLIEQDALLRPLLEPTEQQPLNLAWLLSALPKRYQDAQRIALAMLSDACKQGRKQLTLAEIKGDIPILTLALIDTLGLVERVAEFFGFAVNLPELNLYLIAPRNGKVQEQLLQMVQKNERDSLDTARTVIHLNITDVLPINFPEDAFKLVTDIGNDDPKSHTFAWFASRGQRFTARWLQPPNELLTPKNMEPSILNYFARRYFKIPELKKPQIELLQRTLSGQDAIGILPTGFGKSLVFQLYALLSPRVTLVISPLKALILDQVNALHRLGWTCVNFILSTTPSEQRHRRLADLFHGHRYRLFYIAPERLQIKSFYDELLAALHNTPLGALVIDEAHCVSEWGHDFRPSYLQIPRLRRLLEGSTHVERRVPLLALTATASELVRADMLDTLQLNPECLIQTTSSDRRNISLSAHPVRPEQGAKSKCLAQLLSVDLPRALHQPSVFEKLGKLGNDSSDCYENAGIVFTVYADPHGKTTFAEGTAEIAAELRKMLGLSKSENLVRTHASRVPKVCPQCGSHDYWKDTPQEATRARFENNDYKCHDCSHIFSRPNDVKKWDETLQACHADFQRDKFPLLVATKGFGMGIDKPNVDFVVHHAFASGLEAYYQEAGRAGRANQHAHVALIYIPPTVDCIRDTIDQGELPRCISVPDNFKYRKCPYKLKVLCDFSHQARFIQDSYPGIEADCEITYGVYQRLRYGQPLASHDGVKLNQYRDDSANDSPDADQKKKTYELALHRLQQLGIVQNYTTNYSGGLTNWEFEVESNLNWQPKSLLDHVHRFLEHSRRPDTDDITEPMQILAKLAVECGSPPWPNEHLRPEIALIKKSIGTLLRRVYSRVRAMRLQMLRNELDYVLASENICRRVVLLNLFNKEQDAVPDNYRCGFCDVCVPDLNFQQDFATNSISTVEIEDLVSQLGKLLKPNTGLNPNQLHTFVEQVKKKGVVLGTLSRATKHLEGDPASLSALYLAGVLSLQVTARHNQALSYLRTGFNEGRQQNIKIDVLLDLFYRHGAQIDVESALRWLNDLAPPMNDLNELLERIRRLDNQSPAYLALSSIIKVRKLQQRLNKINSNITLTLKKLSTQ